MCIAFHSGVDAGCGCGTALYDEEDTLVCVVLDEYS
jgi:hypothetical protein